MKCLYNAIITYNVYDKTLTENKRVRYRLTKKISKVRSYVTNILSCWMHKHYAR